MKMKWLILGLAALGILTSGAPHATAEMLISNGNFETGSFAGWTVGSTQVSPFQAALNDGQNSQVVNSVSGQPAWFLRNKAANYFGIPATPITNFSAFNGFDGSPGYFFLRQTFAFDEPLDTALLLFDFAVQSNYSGQDRLFDVNILSTNDTVLSNVFHYVRPQGYLPTWSPTNVSTDIADPLNMLGAGTYQLEFRITIPQNFTGPAQFAIDNISLDAQTAEAQAVPEPTTLASFCTGALCLLGYRWRRSRRPAGLSRRADVSAGNVFFPS